MARNFDGSASYLTQTAIPNVTVCTIAMMVNPNSLPAPLDLDVLCTFYLQSESEAFTTHDKQLFLDSAGRLDARIYSGGSKTVGSTGTLSTGVWAHVALTSDGSTLKTWINGANDGSVAAGASDGGYSDPSFRLCGIPQGPTGLGEISLWRYDGKMAEVAIYNVALTADEMAALAKGYSPLVVRPSALVSYMPLVRDLTDAKLAAPTETSTTVSDHPRVIYPSSAPFLWAVPAGGAPPPTSLPLLRPSLAHLIGR